MKKYQKFLAATVSTAVVASVAVPFNVMSASASVKEFSDVGEGSFYYDAVIELTARKVLNGFGDGTFKPNQVVTRGETAAIIARALNLTASESTALTYTDVHKGDWNYSAIAAVTEAGIMVGKSNKEFAPNETLTRAQMAKVISIAYNLKADSQTSNKFTDVKSDRWYANYVESLMDNKVTKGLTKTTYGPNEFVTRGQLATFIYRADMVEVASTIEKVTDTNVTISGVTYQLSESVKSIFNTKNASVLQNAKIKFVSEGNTITDITYLEITSSGTASNTQNEYEGYMELDGQKGTLNGDLVISADYVSVKNLTVKGNFTVSNQVQNGFYSNQLVVEGETVIEEDQVEAASTYTTASTDKFYQSLTMSAKEPITYSTAAEIKVKIVFENSTFKVVAVNKNGVSVEATGSTTLLEISVSSNAAITAGEGVAIPKLTLKIGAKEVELNGSVQEISVDSIEDITVSGTANIDNVIIKEKVNVDLNTTGEIKKIESQNKDAKIKIKEGTKVGNVVVPEGSDVKDVIENYDDVKENIEQIGGEANEDATPAPPVTPSISVGTVASIDRITVEVTMAELSGVTFKWNGADVLNSTYQNGKYTIKVPLMTSGENNTLVISKSGYNSSTKTVVWIDPLTYEVSELGQWVTDRTEPENWSIADGWITLTTKTEPANNWYAWHGRKSVTDNTLSKNWKVETEIELTEELLERNGVRSSMWLNVQNPEGQTIDWSILQFKIDETEGTMGWQTWDSSDTGAWVDVEGIPTTAGTYKLAIYYDNGMISQYINGIKVDEYEVGEGELSSVKEVIFNSYSFGESYSTQWKVPTVEYVFQEMEVEAVDTIDATTVEVTMEELAGASFKWNGEDVLASNYQNGKYTLTVPLISSGETNSLTIEKSGFNSYSNNSVVWTDPLTYVNSQLGEWVTDRTEPEHWSIVDGWISLTTKTEPANNWYAWHGKKSVTDNALSSNWKVETEIQLTNELLARNGVRSSMWLNVQNNEGDTIDWSILQFKIDESEGTKGWQWWNSEGSWEDIEGIPTLAGTYKLAIYYNNGMISQYINGIKVNEYTVGEAEITSVKEVIFNSYSFGESYSTQWKVPTVEYVLQPVTVANSQELEDALAKPGYKVISLAANTNFQGQFEITRDVTIVGQEGSTITAPDTMVQNGRNSSIILVKNGATATIENVVIDGAGKGTNGARFTGISFEDAGGEVKNVVVKDIKNGMDMNGMQEGIGIYAYNQDGESRTLKVSGSTVTGYQKGGLVLSGDGLTVDVKGNTVTGAGETEIIAQNGIQVGYGATGSITGNTVTDHVCTTPGWVGSASGILLWDPGLGYQVDSNVFDNNDMDFYENVPPVVSGVTDNYITNSSVTPMSTDSDIDTVSLTLDGVEQSDYSLGTEIIDEGLYVLTVTDNLENTTTISFVIDKTGATMDDANLHYTDDLWGSISATGTKYVDVELTFSEDMNITNNWNVSFWTKDSNGNYIEIEGGDGRTVQKDQSWSGAWKDMTVDSSGGTGATTFKAGNIYATAVNDGASYASDDWWNALWAARDAGDGVWVKISVTDNAGNVSEVYAPIATEM